MQQLGTATVELPVVRPAVAGGDEPAAVEVPAGDTAVLDEAVGGSESPPEKSILIFVEAFTPGQQQRVLSLWNAGDPDGLLGFAVGELRRGGWFDSGGVPEGSDPVVCRRLALASALMVAVAAFEAASLSDQVPLDEVDQMLRLLLDRQDIPAADLVVSGEVGQ